MAGRPVLGDLDFGNASKIVNLPDPSSAQHAATKNYVDSVASGLGGAAVLITTSGSHSIAAGTTAVLIQLASAGSVDLTLPTVAAQGKFAIAVSDFAGNLTALSAAADAGDTGGIMGLTGAVAFGGSNGQGPGMAQGFILVPSSLISGWSQC